ncbi:MAG: alanine--tRNA ligase [Lachnospiraceae bacterium]|nr:alanine--tRNA ligase [Lachnospiraceae bacterium]MBR4540760.1 alanine--tRNA ligase [Lachnospiraceae bacterium]
MKKITSSELRKAWIDFYKERGHVDCGAVSLVSDGSTGVMFNVAGMQPLMPYLLGQKHPLGTRLCNVQGCIRTNDIDSVGDKSHGTFFEMMGSWSLGDYFKEDRCKWSFELLTQLFGFDADHLAATVFAGDENAPRDEEGAKFRELSGFKKENIFYLPAEDNWWGLEYGPCGPDSEMFYVKDVPPCGPDCKPGCHCGKYTEIGNDVFMQYEKHHDGTLTPLKQKNVDTGWGLERNLAFLNGFDDVYKIDVHVPAITAIEEASGIKYDSDEKLTRSMRILADHTRTAVMLIGDEAKLLPSNAGAGYVLRRLIRRAVRHARTLGLKKENILKVAETYISVYSESYPNVLKNKEFILTELGKEIERFEATLENGLKEFKKILETKQAEKSTDIDGKEAFYLYDTFGFPLELTVELAEEESLKVDEAGFAAAMEEQKQKAREGKSFSQKLTGQSVFDNLDESITTAFTGYESLNETSEILVIAGEDALADKVNAGEKATIITKVTPFYATMGGQKGDTGIIKTANGEFKVEEAVKLPGGRTGHVGEVVSGSIAKGEKAELSVNTEGRNKTCRNHSATHLLQAALRKVLGNGVEQQGSYQDTERTRFDFSYGQAMTAEEIEKVETIVNENIEKDLAVVTDVMSIDEAKKTGAMALFGEKYGDSVRVVSMGDFSKELCGGTHVKHTGDIASFKILSESGVAAGVRRIEAITGSNVIAYYKKQEELLKEAAAAAKTQPASLIEKIQHLMADNKALSSELDSLKAKMAKDSLGNVLDSVTEVKGVKVLAAKVPGVDMNGLRDLSDNLCEKMGGGIAVLISEADGKVNLVAKATDDAIAKGAHAGNLIKAIAPIVGGGGGGRPNMAQAGGKNPAGIEECIKAVAGAVEAQIK